MDVANARYPEDVQASFEHNCLEAQKSEIFYKVVGGATSTLVSLACGLHTRHAVSVRTCTMTCTP
jgi:hypothetical protein